MRSSVLLSLLLCAPSARAKDVVEAKLETGISTEGFLLNLFLLPLAYGFSLPHLGFSRYPYEAPRGYGGGPRQLALSSRASVQRLRRGRVGRHAELRVRDANRLGWNAAADAYGDGVFHPTRAGALYSGHLTSNYLQSTHALLELGLGFASFQDPTPRWGPGAELALELFPGSPWAGRLRYHASLLEKQGFHDLSAELGLSWRWLGAAVSYRALLTPVGGAYGPGLSLQAWF